MYVTGVPVGIDVIGVPVGIDVIGVPVDKYSDV